MLSQFELKSLDLYDDLECNNFINLYNNDLDRIVQDQYRDVYIKSININDHPEILNSVLEANHYFYKFDFCGLIECYFAKYEKNCHYDAMHIDCKVGLLNQRKLSFSLLLNDEFEGGEFCTYSQTLEKKKGRLITFPSFLPHKVNPVLSGSRFVCFGFFLGPNWN